MLQQGHLLHTYIGWTISYCEDWCHLKYETEFHYEQYSPSKMANIMKYNRVNCFEISVHNRNRVGYNKYKHDTVACYKASKRANDRVILTACVFTKFEIKKIQNKHKKRNKITWQGSCVNRKFTKKDLMYLNHVLHNKEFRNNMIDKYFE